MSSADPKRLACDATAALLVAPFGLRTARLLQAAGLLDAAAKVEDAQPAAVAAGDDDAPTAIGAWAPHREGDSTVFVRPPSLSVDDSLAPVERLLPKAAGTKRVVVIGESVAVAAFYAPDLRLCDLVLDALRAEAPAERWDVVDLAQLGLGGIELVHRAHAALQLQPDVLVVVAGNNWAGPASDEREQEGRQRTGLLLEQGGVAAIAGAHAARHATLAAAVLDDVAAIAAYAEARLVVVVPGVNLADFERTRPVGWLPGDGTARWHGLLDDARAALAAGDGAGALACARELTSLDEGTCPTSFLVAARAHHLLGDVAAERAALVAAVDADGRAVLPYLGMVPGVSSSLRAKLLAFAAAGGHAVVDLEAVTAGDAPIAGAGAYVDYCHLTKPALDAAAAAIATAVASSTSSKSSDGAAARTALAARPTPPHVDARARLQAALHSLHMDAPLDGSRARVARFVDEAIAADPGVLDALVDLVLARAAPGLPMLHESFARLERSPFRLPMSAFLRLALDAPFIDIVVAALRRTRGDEAAEKLLSFVLDHHAVEDRLQDLAHPFFHASRWDALPNASGVHTGQQLVRSIVRASRFGFMSRARGDLQLTITARAQHADGGEVRVALNGVSVLTIPVEPTWRRATATLPAAALIRGVNELVVTWPPPRGDGDAMLATCAQRLQSGVPADLVPILGELCRLQVGPV